jgi:hypothetical protein
VKKLSISTAWDETRQVLARDGKLFTSVALALIVLPATVLALVAPPLGEEPPGWVRLLSMVVALIGLAGQLAIIRLALTSSTLVKDAIAHGFKRLLPAFVALVLFGVAMAIILLPIMLLMVGPEAIQAAAEGTITPEMARAVLVIVLLVILVGARFQLIMPVAAAEPIGPIAVLKRSWAISKGHYWRLLAFVVLNLLLAVIVVIYLGHVIGGVVVGAIFGDIDQFSVAALAAGLISGLAQAAFTVVLSVMLARIYAQLAGTAEASVPSSGT